MRRIVETLAEVLESWGLKLPAPRPALRTGPSIAIYVRSASDRQRIGTLSQDARGFVFSYTPAAKSDSTISPLPAFPDKGTVYTSPVLFPFFGARLPPTDRVDVKRHIEAQGIDPTDTLALLAEVGGRSVASPYELALDPA